MARETQISATSLCFLVADAGMVWQLPMCSRTILAALCISAAAEFRVPAGRQHPRNSLEVSKIFGVCVPADPAEIAFLTTLGYNELTLLPTRSRHALMTLARPHNGSQPGARCGVAQCDDYLFAFRQSKSKAEARFWRERPQFSRGAQNKLTRHTILVVDNFAIVRIPRDEVQTLDGIPLKRLVLHMPHQACGGAHLSRRTMHLRRSAECGLIHSSIAQTEATACHVTRSDRVLKNCAHPMFAAQHLSARKQDSAMCFDRPSSKPT